MNLNEWLVQLDKTRDDIIKLAVQIQDMDENDKRIAEYLFQAKFENISDMIVSAIIEKASEVKYGGEVN